MVYVQAGSISDDVIFILLGFLFTTALAFVLDIVHGFINTKNRSKAFKTSLHVVFVLVVAFCLYLYFSSFHGQVEITKEYSFWIALGVDVLLVGFLLFHSMISGWQKTPLSHDFLEARGHPHEKIGFFNQVTGSQLRYLIAITFFEIVGIVLVISYNTLPVIDAFAISVLVVVVLNFVREFLGVTAFLRDAVTKIIEQLLTTLAEQINELINEALHQDPNQYKTRIYLLILSNKEHVFSMKYAYNMEGDRDSQLILREDQGVAGRVLRTHRPAGLCPYDIKKLNLTDEQMVLIRKDIVWKLCYPLCCDHKKIFGVMAIDSNAPLQLEHLNKMADFSHAMATSIAIVLSAYPGPFMQDAFKNN